MREQTAVSVRRSGASDNAHGPRTLWRIAQPALLVAVLLIGVVAAMQRPRALALAPESAAFAYAATGWNEAERAADGAAFRWTSDEATLTFRAARRVLPANRVVTLTMAFAPRPAGSPVRTVTLLVNGRVVDAWPSDIAHPVAVDVSAFLRQADALDVMIRTEPFSPRGDPRALGILLLGDARLTAARGFALPAPDAVASAVLLAALAALAVGRRAQRRRRLIAAGATGVVVVLGVLLARVTFWRLALPLELLLAAVVAARWAREWWAALAWPVRAVQNRLRLDARALTVGGIVTAIAGQAVIALHRGTPLGVPLLVIGLVTALVAAPNPYLPPYPASPQGKGSRNDTSADADGRSLPHVPLPQRTLRTREGVRGRGPLRWQILALVGIAAVAVGLRLALVTEMPASLFRDEARHALKALRILDDPAYRPVYEPEIALPALFLYPLALWFKVFGVSVLTLRAFMAAAGVADVLLLFLVGRRLFGARVGLIAAFLFAASFWALRMQRVALAPAFSTGLVLLALWLFVRAVQTRRWRDWALAGAGAAGTVYGYHSGPFALVLMAGVAVAFLVQSPSRFARLWLPRMALFAGVFLVLAAPLVRYVATHWEQYTARPAQTAIFSEANLRRLGQDRLAALEANILPNLGMYTVRGDREPKHNLPDAPHLDATMAALFLLGLALALSGWFARAPDGAPPFGRQFVLGYLGAMLLPAMLAIDAPNTLRAFDTLPPALLLAALGMEAVWVRLSVGAVGEPRAAGTRLGTLLVALLCLVILTLNGGTYFWRMRADGRETLRFDTYFASQAGKRIAAESLAAGETVTTYYVPRAAMDRDVFPFFARVAAGAAVVRPLEEVDPAALPARYAILLPNGAGDPPPDTVIAALPWARDLARLPGDSPAGAGGVPAFMEYRR